MAEGHPQEPSSEQAMTDDYRAMFKPLGEVSISEFRSEGEPPDDERRHLRPAPDPEPGDEPSAPEETTDNTWSGENAKIRALNAEINFLESERQKAIAREKYDWADTLQRQIQTHMIHRMRLRLEEIENYQNPEE